MICFIFGSGPSLYSLSTWQLQHMEGYISLGLNYSFLFPYLTTHHYLGYEPSSIQSIEKIMTDWRRDSMRGMPWFLPWRSLFRGFHPLFVPKLFPYGANIKMFRMQPRLLLDRDREFMAEDFKKSLRYRGVMSVGLYLAEKLGAKKIVLLGVDLHTTAHFFDDYEEMREDVKLYKEKMGEGPFESMVPKGSSYRTMAEYYGAVDRLYFRPKGIKLLVGTDSPIISDVLEAYKWV